MISESYRTQSGRPVPAVTAREMAEVDRVAVEDVGLELLQMMENAGRNLARHVRSLAPDRVVVYAGSGGNGGGGLACARHLHNRGVDVVVVLDRAPGALTGAPATQLGVLEATPVEVRETSSPAEGADVVVDALVGYGLDGRVREPAASLIRAVNASTATVVSLDVPSGIDATSGDPQGVAVDPETTVTLALPKTGLRARETPVVLADIAIPAAVYDRAGLAHDSPFEDAYLEALDPV